MNTDTASSRIDHSSCGHARTLAGHRACRALRAAMAADPDRIATADRVASTGTRVLLPELA